MTLFTCQVTEHLQAAILHFHYPIGPEVAVRSYIVSARQIVHCKSCIQSTIFAVLSCWAHTHTQVVTATLLTCIFMMMFVLCLLQQYILCFKTLFSEPCLKCHRYLDTISKLPPTWRDFFSCKVYHEDCKPWRSGQWRAPSTSCRPRGETQAAAHVAGFLVQSLPAKWIHKWKWRSRQILSLELHKM